MQFEMYEHPSPEDPSKNQWCWRLRDSNNKTQAYCADNFANKELCETNIRALIALDHTVSIVCIPNREPNMMSAFLEKLFNQRKKMKSD